MIQNHVVLIFLLAVVYSAVHSTAEADPLRLGTNVWPGYEPLYLARELGYLDPISAKLVEYLSASEVLRAFKNGAIEAAALTLDEVLSLWQYRVQAQVVLVTDISHGGDAIVGRPNIRGVKGLQEKRVGVEGTALGAYVLTRALQKYDIDLGDLEIVQLEVGEHESAYLGNQVDALVTFEPVRTKLLAGGAKELFSSREIPNEIVDVIVVHKDYLSSHPGEVRHVISAWYRALEYLAKDPNDAAQRMGKRLRMNTADVLRSYEGLRLPGREENLSLLSGDAPRLLSLAKALQEVMLSAELLRIPVPVENLLGPTVVELHRR